MKESTGCGRARSAQACLKRLAVLAVAALALVTARVGLAQDDTVTPLPVGTTIDLSVSNVGSPIRDVALPYVAVEDNGLWVLQADGKTIQKVSAPVESIAALATDGATCFIAADGGVFSGQPGEWHAQVGAIISALCIQADPPLYLAGAAHGMWRSVDGQQWSAVTFPDVGVAKCAIAGTTAYAGTADGLFRSMDSGVTWAKASPVIGTRDMPGVSAQGDKVYVATAGGGLYVSADRATTWSPVQGVPRGLEDVVMAGTSVSLLSDGVVWQSANNGESWTSTELAGAQSVKAAAFLKAVEALQ